MLRLKPIFIKTLIKQSFHSSKSLYHDKSTIGTKAVISSLKGNAFITAIKYGAYCYSGSSALLSETFHSLLDLVNQALLWFGLRNSAKFADSDHNYGYGRSVYFWSLVSAMGIFWVGFVGCTFSGLHQIFISQMMPEFTWLTGLVLFTSFSVDFSIFVTVLRNVNKERTNGITLYQYIKNIKDPVVLAVLLEDISATLGVMIASIGIGLTIYTGNPLYDGIASVLIGGLLGFTAVSLVLMNQRFLLGKAVDVNIQDGIVQILKNRPSIEAIHAVQTQWISPNNFSFKCEVDYNGVFLSKELQSLGYAQEFNNASKESLSSLLGTYSEDLIRLVERETRDIENEIRMKYPQAGFIDLEPFSKESKVLALKGEKISEKDLELN